ncbi:hypothetical protein GCM10010196_08970 [Agromyces mediolanus]|uniref:Uncharacterized protein n=1 Tax=Agromyces mediolanus TaxID=41986 RepID=A0A918CF40_AGRME|nr:hypothetical protein GCM10010196_08970 [Agromyces mediolanus]GLJ71489.1 hypothetical protein GCM10017583_07450 [Agromyces mediolanus]
MNGHVLVRSFTLGARCLRAAARGVHTAPRIRRGPSNLRSADGPPKDTGTRKHGLDEQRSPPPHGRTVSRANWVGETPYARRNAREKYSGSG